MVILYIDHVSIVLKFKKIEFVNNLSINVTQQRDVWNMMLQVNKVFIPSELLFFALLKMFDIVTTVLQYYVESNLLLNFEVNSFFCSNISLNTGQNFWRKKIQKCVLLLSSSDCSFLLS